MNALESNALDALENSAKAQLALVAEMRAARGDGDEWLPLPRKKTASRDAEVCSISGRSRSWVTNHKDIRTKSTTAGTFYSGKDVREIISGKEGK